MRPISQHRHSDDRLSFLQGRGKPGEDLLVGEIESARILARA